MCSCACGFALDLECRNDLELTHGSFLHSSLCKHANNLKEREFDFLHFRKSLVARYDI